MKITSTQKVKTGLFVTIAFGFLLLIIFLIGKEKNIFTKTYIVYTNFKNISGLKAGNLVRFAGIDVGTVDDIRIINDTTVRIDLLLNESYKPYIKTDGSASIGSDGLMGDKLVQISRGSDSSKLVKDGGRILSAEPVEMDKMVAKISKIADNAELLTGNLAEVVGKINNGKGSIGRLLSNDNLAKQLETTVSSTRETVSSIRKTADNVSDNMEAAKHSFLLRGYFKKKERKRIKDSTVKANSVPSPGKVIKKN